MGRHSILDDLRLLARLVGCPAPLAGKAEEEGGVYGGAVACKRFRLLHRHASQPNHGVMKP